MKTINNSKVPNHAILLMCCPDQKGLVAIVTDFLHKNDGNIIYLDQNVDQESKTFFMRVEWDLDNFLIPDKKIGDYFQTLISSRYNMDFQLYFTRQIPRMAIFVSKISHCFYDVLSNVESGDWSVQVPLIISNHLDMQSIANQFGIEYIHLPLNQENKVEIEQKEIQILKDHKIDFIVLARYMQILSGEFIREFPNRIINIHHSFLPAFPGAKPYHSAYERGVKIIGATSHYVTEELDAGPIIEQGVAKVSHKESISDLVRKGKNIEKIVLSQAVKLHIERRILVFGNRTIVFD